ncbi:MAG: hypothetical protein HRT95_09010 [Moritella sp.]|uniref:hypothetical protein n=1 Tax=Moritella sp. TaxID=78556 RepID=UPI001D87856F|nr:hypothetical protein [Moritella sp.]NQZ50307.1 hypothetical protein [Moritella sp.]
MTLYLTFSLCTVIDLYFVSMQRSSIKLIRNADMLHGTDMFSRFKAAGDLRIMLPLWANAVWVVKAVKLMVLYYIYMESGVYIAFAVFLVPLLISFVLALPYLCHLFHRFYLEIFEARLNYLDSMTIELSEAEARALSQTIDNAKAYYKIG